MKAGWGDQPHQKPCPHVLTSVAMKSCTKVPLLEQGVPGIAGVFTDFQVYQKRLPDQESREEGHIYTGAHQLEIEN